MAEVKLNTTSSITDYLKSVGKASDFGSRASLYKSSGLEERLGAYTGSPNQNSAFLKSLQAPSQTGEVKPSPAGNFTQASQYLNSMNPTGATSAVKTAATTPASSLGNFSIYGAAGAPTIPGVPTTTQTSTPATMPGGVTGGTTTPTSTTPTSTAPATQGNNFTLASSLLGRQSQQASASQAMDYASRTGASAAASYAPPPQDTSATSAMSQASGTPEQAAPTMSAKDAGIYNPSEAELADTYFNSPEFRAAREKYELAGMSAASIAQSAKEDLEAKYNADKSAVETALGRAGLFMSGIRSSQVASLAQSLAMQNNQVDRQTAQKLLESDATFKKDILAGITDVVKSAKDGNKQAIEQLNKAGLAVVGDKLVPTLESQRADIAQQQFELSQARLDLDAAKFEYAQAKGDAQLAQAQQRIDMALQKLQTPSTGSMLSISEAKSLGLPVALVGTSESDIISSLSSTSVPKWFEPIAGEGSFPINGVKIPLTRSQMQQKWNEFRANYTAASGTSNQDP